MEDVFDLLPHSKKESKIEAKGMKEDLGELCESHTCSNCIVFESKKKQDLFIWLAKYSEGPSIKFQC